jgi:hypothetical protein
MIDPATGWFEIVKATNKSATSIQDFHIPAHMLLILKKDNFHSLSISNSQYFLNVLPNKLTAD